jgi:hypothetical protein
MTKRNAIVAWGLLVAAAVASPSVAQAQTAQVDRNIQRAEKHEAKAQEQTETRNRWDQAAWNYRRAGGLRPIGDPQQAQSFAMAGRLSYYTGDPIQAMQDFERAANAALYTGDIEGAANLFADAAWVAAQGGNADSAKRIAEHVRALTTAPNFRAESRGLVLGRLDGSGVQAPSPAVGTSR